MLSEPYHVLYYDGVCGLCNWLVRFVIARDHAKAFRFAAIQGEHGTQALTLAGHDPGRLDTVYVRTRAGVLLQKSRAILFVLAQVGFPWSLIALLRFLPTFALDLGYDGIARIRYRIWGRFPACPVPTDDVRSRFLD